MSQTDCVLCGADGGPNMTTIMWRVNFKGEPGLFSCTECRPYFGKQLQDTADVLTRAADVRAKTSIPIARKDR
jgi:hypothetical protein